LKDKQKKGKNFTASDEDKLGELEEELDKLKSSLKSPQTPPQSYKSILIVLAIAVLVLLGIGFLVYKAKKKKKNLRDIKLIDIF